ncbi:S1 family peptidase [Halorhodospira halophila]|uniref:Peptidase S1 and S6, chymotrypsin/Hap n=1 Tax=Halorhodospira halophila (strain DSM 244 / SL1) TaxID=349124 RepID=A1WX57_HALHL|nr:serine protease [Halorhodospira halophila]ABM62269.1 peptidase S1 and S6, chymotrypsin/Hap [Halorhodospira halophila SL1]MBK1729244.1 serine protease [Halorhodospira halophila]
MTRHPRSLTCWLLGLGALLLIAKSTATSAFAKDDLADTIESITPSVVGVGTHAPTRNPRVDFRGTGFVIADGNAVLTNQHVLPETLDEERRESLIVLVGEPGSPDIRTAEPVARSRAHDLAILRIEGDPLPALNIGDPNDLRPGNQVAYTGFPIGMVIGFYPVTHTAIISARTPLALPAQRDDQLDPGQVARLRREEPPMVFQLDGTAYPGNSGSPVYDISTGQVYAVLNKVFVQGGREAAVREPSGISYAIPLDLAESLVEEYEHEFR